MATAPPLVKKMKKANKSVSLIAFRPSETVAGALGGLPQGVSAVSVPLAARLLEVSAQRVRLLLAQGRLSGQKDPETGVWVVFLGVPVREGRRGPRLRAVVGKNAYPVLGGSKRKKPKC